MSEEERTAEKTADRESETTTEDPVSTNLSGYNAHSLPSVDSFPRLKPKSKFGVAVPKRLNEPRLYYNSRHINYDDLSTQMFDDLSGGFNFGSMAFEEKDDYAKVNHTHSRYSKVTGEQIADTKDKISLGKISLINPVFDDYGNYVYQKQVLDLCIPRDYDKMPEAKEADIGTIKFKAIPKLKQIDVNSKDFDGWVYPDGREIDGTEFVYAYEYFGTNYGGDPATKRFNLPNLNTFIKANPGVKTEESQNLVVQDCKNAVLPHRHEITDIQYISGSDIPVTLTIPTGDNSNGNSTHQSSLPEVGSITCKLTLSCKNIKLEDCETTESDPDDSKTEPTSNYLPVFIYIGKKKVV